MCESAFALAIPSRIPAMEDGVMLITFCADARGAVERRAKRKADAMKRIPWRSLLVWAVPVLAFAWLAVAGRAATAPMQPAGGAVASTFAPLADGPFPADRGARRHQDERPPGTVR